MQICVLCLYILYIFIYACTYTHTHTHTHTYTTASLICRRVNYIDVSLTIDSICLENLFSLVRIRKPVPTPLEFKYALKMISTAQFFTLPRTGSYEEDDGEFLADYLNHEPIL